MAPWKLIHNCFACAKPTYDQLKEESKSLRYGSIALPASDIVHVADIRTRAQVRCLRVLNALQQWPARADGAQPKLADLGLPPEATVDPFNGSPLNLRKVGGEWLIYSVGKELIDKNDTMHAVAKLLREKQTVSVSIFLSPPMEVSSTHGRTDP